MPRIRPSFIMVAILALALATAIACGSKKTEETPKAAATTAATAAASATAAPKTGGATSSAPPAGGITAITSANFKQAMCNDYKSVAGKVPGAAGPSSGAPSATAETAAIQTMMTQMVNAAPAELKPDMTVVAKYFSEYTAAMSRAGGDMMKLAQDPAFIKMMESGSTEMEKATQNIEAWQKKNC